MIVVMVLHKKTGVVGNFVVKSLKEIDKRSYEILGIRNMTKAPEAQASEAQAPEAQAPENRQV